VTSVRGDVIPVLDLGIRLLGVPARRPGRLVLVRHEATAPWWGCWWTTSRRWCPRRGRGEGDPEAARSALPPELVAGVVAHEHGVVTVLRLARAAAPPDDDSR
jgi:hypothetical protein